jgi:hypothetical protein
MAEVMVTLRVGSGAAFTMRQSFDDEDRAEDLFREVESRIKEAGEEVAQEAAAAREEEEKS